MGNGFKLSDPSPVRKERILLLSTQHLSAATMEWLGKADGYKWPVHPRNDYGFFIRADSDIWDFSTLNGDLVAALQFAKDRNVEWILFDNDEDPIKGLATYDDGAT